MKLRPWHVSLALNRLLGNRDEDTLSAQVGLHVHRGDRPRWLWLLVAGAIDALVARLPARWAEQNHTRKSMLRAHPEWEL